MSVSAGTLSQDSLCTHRSSVRPVSNPSLKYGTGKRVGRGVRPRSPSSTNGTNMLASRVQAQGDEKLIQLLERLANSTRTTRRNRSVESFLRGIEVVHNDQRLVTAFFKGHCGDGPAFTTFLIRPDEAGMRCHFDVSAEEFHWPLRSGVTECETVRASRANVGLAGKEGHSIRLRCPPPLEQLWLGPRLEHQARRAVEGSRNDYFTLGLPFHRRAVLHGGWLTLSFCVHRLSPSVSVPQQPCPTRRNVRPRAGGTSRSMPTLPPTGAGRACRSARARPSAW